MKKYIFLLVLFFTFSLPVFAYTKEDYQKAKNYVTIPESYVIKESKHLLTVSGLTDPEVYYQWTDITNANELLNARNEAVQALTEYEMANNNLNELEQILTGSLTEEDEARLEEARKAEEDALTNYNEKLDLFYEHLTSDANYIEEDFVEAVNNDYTNKKEMQENHSYLLWVKVADDNATYYSYQIYDILPSENTDVSDVTNPDTGIFDTVLWIAVPTAIIIGSVIIFKRKVSES